MNVLIEANGNPIGDGAGCSSGSRSGQQPQAASQRHVLLVGQHSHAFSPRLSEVTHHCVGMCKMPQRATGQVRFKMYVRVSRAKLQLEQNVVGSCAKVPCVPFSLSSPTCLLNCLTTYLPAYLPIYLCYAACHLSVLYRNYLACTETCSELFCTSGVHACTEASVMCRQPLATDLAFGVGALTLGM